MPQIKERDKVTFSARLGEQHLTQRHFSLLSRCCRGSARLLRSCRAKGEVESAEMG